MRLRILEKNRKRTEAEKLDIESEDISLGFLRYLVFLKSEFPDQERKVLISLYKNKSTNDKFFDENYSLIKYIDEEIEYYYKYRINFDKPLPIKLYRIHKAVNHAIDEIILMHIYLRNKIFSVLGEEFSYQFDKQITHEKFWLTDANISLFKGYLQNTKRYLSITAKKECYAEFRQRLLSTLDDNNIHEQEAAASFFGIKKEDNKRFIALRVLINLMIRHMDRIIYLKTKQQRQ